MSNADPTTEPPAVAPSAPPMPPRKPWLAVLLVLLFGPVSFVYCGRLRRAALWFIASWVTVVFFGAGILYFVSGPAFMALWSIPPVALYVAAVIDAVRVARRSTNLPRRPYQRLWVYVLLIIGSALFSEVALRGIRSWTEAFVIPTGGMRETVLPGDRILVDKLALRMRAPRRGEVVVHFEKGPGTPILIKRVIGLPGDEIEIRDEQVFRNGEPLAEPYVHREGELSPNLPQLADTPARRVMAGEVFLLGDNRRASKDSRIDGPYALADVIGVARVVYWSREYSLHPPDLRIGVREETESWGPVRWTRIGTRLDRE